jgi:methylmalonyl-CoA mutase C-terminal domain/subunit
MSMSNEKIKVITGKIGTDGHYRGIEAVTRALRDAGMEVVYLGAGRRVEEVIKAVSQEDADVLGLSFLCGGHMQTMKKVMDRIKEKDLDRVLVLAGGIIYDDEIPEMKELGVADVFLPGTPLADIVDYVSVEVEKRKNIQFEPSK